MRAYTIMIVVATLLLLNATGLNAQYRGGGGGGGSSQRTQEESLDGTPTAGMFSGGAGGGTNSASSESTRPALPLTLLDFRAEQRAEVVLLAWQTEQERDVLHFSVERSGDGHTFTLLHQLAATGGGAPGGQQSYAVTDQQPLGGTSYYRLRMMDLDGSFRYSPLRSVTYSVEKWSFTVYPNPTPQATFRVKLTGPGEDEDVAIRVYHASGRLLYEQLLATSVNQEAVNVSPPHLPAGTYLVRVRRGNGESSSKKLIVID